MLGLGRDAMMNLESKLWGKWRVLESKKKGCPVSVILILILIINKCIVYLCASICCIHIPLSNSLKYLIRYLLFIFIIQLRKLRLKVSEYFVQGHPVRINWLGFQKADLAYFKP